MLAVGAAVVLGCLGVLTVVGSAAAGPAPAPVRMTLPTPTGPHQIGTVELHLVDPTRTDPWAPGHPVRELMVQVWYPARDAAPYPVAPWLAPGAVASFEQHQEISPGSVTLPLTHGHVGAPVDRSGRPLPVLLYSPGMHEDRAVGTTLVEDLASHGYVVVAIDHTHDAGEVEFPGGRLEVGMLPADTPELDTQDVEVRAADSSFVLDRLTVLNRGGNPDAEHRTLPAGLRGALDLSRVGMVGHSMGGAAAAQAMYRDPRITAGADLDGTLYGSVLTGGLDRPFLLMGSQYHDRTVDDSWAQLWSNLRGRRLELRMSNSEHDSYDDGESLLPEIATVMGVTADQLAQRIGTIDPARALLVLRVYVRAFFDATIRGGGDRLLDRPSPRYPEIEFIP